jgi:hypothetical protein
MRGVGLVLTWLAIFCFSLMCWIIVAWAVYHLYLYCAG